MIEKFKEFSILNESDLIDRLAEVEIGNSISFYSRFGGIYWNDKSQCYALDFIDRGSYDNFCFFEKATNILCKPSRLFETFFDDLFYALHGVLGDNEQCYIANFVIQKIYHDTKIYPRFVWNVTRLDNKEDGTIDYDIDYDFSY